MELTTAIALSKQNKTKLTHPHFVPKEWMIVDENDIITFEDGYSTSVTNFMKDRKGDSWQYNWSEYEEQ